MIVDEILEAISLPKDEIQRVQTAHRLKLIEFWEIPQGARVLEIGCGQGDTLSALAYIVGKNGYVRGVDIASGSYGSPETLGKARERLLSSPIGKNMRIDFDFDVLKEDLGEKFDYAVLSHCLWYLASEKELTAIFAKLKTVASHLCVAEWDARATLPEQLPHLTAVTVQAICESFKTSSHSNVRTMFYPNDIENAAKIAGWNIEKAGGVFSPDMQDGKWEVGAALELYPQEIDNCDMPPKLKSLLHAKLGELRTAKEIKPLSAFCMLCK